MPIMLGLATSSPPKARRVRSRYHLEPPMKLSDPKNPGAIGLWQLGQSVIPHARPLVRVEAAVKPSDGKTGRFHQRDRWISPFLLERTGGTGPAGPRSLGGSAVAGRL